MPSDMTLDLLIKSYFSYKTGTPQNDIIVVGSIHAHFAIVPLIVGLFSSIIFHIACKFSQQSAFPIIYYIVWSSTKLF